MFVGAGFEDVVSVVFAAQQAFPPAATDFLQQAAEAVAAAPVFSDACPSFLQHAFASLFAHEVVAVVSFLQLALSLQHFLSANIVPAIKRDRDNKSTFFIFFCLEYKCKGIFHSNCNSRKY